MSKVWEHIGTVLAEKGKAMSKDYIKREDAIRDIERIMADHPLQGYEDECLIIKAVEQVPSADVVEVVRCKDCTNRDAETMFCLGRGWPTSMVPDNGYCDKGRKERQ